MALCCVLQRQVEVSTVAEAYFQMLLKLCDSQIDVSFLSAVLGSFCFLCTINHQCEVNLLDVIFHVNGGNIAWS